MKHVDREVSLTIGICRTTPTHTSTLRCNYKKCARGRIEIEHYLRRCAFGKDLYCFRARNIYPYFSNIDPYFSVIFTG